ncbi:MULTISPECIES: ATP-binding protein [Marinovum]|uniref:ATP-binding protein n=1 Tax=Marinovum TaxID=367771 RepID=UPI00237C526C|nr:ATP-binding protein [Marinovum sp. PR37]MDD9746560.1 ATP-binding protein [Marinovum sp. PR37]
MTRLAAVKGALVEHGRSIRAIVAVAVIVALAVLFVAQQADMTRTKERAMDRVSATSWKVSELVFETLRFSMALRLHATGEVKRADVEFSFELLWSRIDVVDNTAVGATEEMREILTRFRALLAAEEEAIFDRPLIPPRVAVSLAEEMSGIARELRVIWLATFQNRSFAELTLRTLEDAGSERLQTLIVALMGLLVMYVIAEIIYAGVAQKREMRLRQAAAQASEAKTRFLANVSHEIRTPLNGILGMAGELAETRLDTDQTACVKIIRQSGEVLLNTLNDVLDLAKVEAGELVIDRRPFDLAEAIGVAHALYRSTARDKGLRLRTELAPDLPRRVMGDGTRLRQVLHNLISNGLKFTAEGEVRITAERLPDTGRIRISVRDTGPGIAPEDQAMIFRPFTQADVSITRKHGGTGLGLSVSRQLIEAMGGDIGLESAVGEGAIFWFDLDLPAVDPADTAAAAPADAEPAPDAASRAGPRVLVVDDNATNRLLLRRFLKDRASRIAEAADGADAVATVEATDFDIILMDIQMPVMDGIEATRRIRRLESANDRPPVRIIAVTANIMEHQRRGYLEEGMNDVIGKPVSKKTLLAKLDAAPVDPAAVAGAA